MATFPSKPGKDRNPWRTSSVPAALSVALLTGLAIALVLGFRAVVGLTMSLLGG